MKFGYWLPAIILAAAIFVMSNLPNPPQPDLGMELGDKILHFMTYTVLSVFVMIGLYGGRSKVVEKKMIILGIVITALYGLSDEIHQAFVPNRMAEFWDWFADALGAIAGTYVYRYICHIKNYKERESNK